MIILVKKAFRDLYRSKLRTISIILAIALSVGLGIGMVNATKDAFASFDHRLEVTNYEDMDINFDTASLDMVAIEQIDGVDTAMGRLFIHTQIQVGEERFKAHWIGSPYYDKEPYSLINGYQMFSGEYVSGANSRECMVGNLFADANGVGKGDDIQVFYNNITLNLTVTGIAGSPEYIYVVDDAGWPQPSLLAPVFCTYEMIAETLGLQPDTYNELLIRVEDGADPSEVKERVEQYLISQGVKITMSLLGTEEADYLFSRADAGAMGSMGWAFGIIICLVTAVVIYNSMNKLIASQRTYIGVMQALGGRTEAILGHYTLFGFFMGLIGGLVGIPLGIFFSMFIMYFYSQLIGLADPVYTIFWYYPLAFLGIAILIATTGAFLGSIKVVRFGPREALTSHGTKQNFNRKPLVEMAADKVFSSRPILPRIPVRNLTRHKIRTGVTVVSLAASLVLVFSCLTLMLGFMAPLEKNYDEYETWDLKATLIEPMSADQVYANLTGYSWEAEVMVDEYIPVQNGDELKFVHIQAFERDSDLRHFHVIDGKKDFDEGVLAGSIIAKKMDDDITPGDDVTFVIGNFTSTVKVTGITGELMDDSILMTLDQVERLFFTGGMVNSIIMNLNGMSRDEAENLLRDKFAIAAIAYTDDVIHGLQSMLEGLMGMFAMFIIFGVVAEVLFISTTVILNILDRETEFISLRAMGTRPSRIRLLIMIESLILLGPGIVLGLIMGYFATMWAWGYIVADLMYYQIEIPPLVYVLTVIIATASTVGASLVSSNHIAHIKLVDRIRRWSV